MVIFKREDSLQKFAIEKERVGQVITILGKIHNMTFIKVKAMTLHSISKNVQFRLTSLTSINFSINYYIVGKEKNFRFSEAPANRIDE